MNAQTNTPLAPAPVADLDQDLKDQALQGQIESEHDAAVVALASHLQQEKREIKEAQDEGYKAYTELSKTKTLVAEATRAAIGQTSAAMLAENKAMEGMIDIMLKAKVEENIDLYNSTMEKVITEFKFALGVDICLKAEKFAKEEKKTEQKYMAELTPRQQQKTFSKTGCHNYDRKRQHFNRYLKDKAAEYAHDNDDLKAADLIVTVQTEGKKTVIKTPKGKPSLSQTEKDDKAIDAIVKAFNTLTVSKHENVLEKLALEHGRDFIDKLTAAAANATAQLDAEEKKEVAAKAEEAQRAAAEAEADQKNEVGDFIDTMDSKHRKDAADLRATHCQIVAGAKNLLPKRELNNLKRKYSRLEKKLKELGYNIDDILAATEKK